jgi:hypothetical protein
MGLVIIVTLTTHHQPALTSCNGTAWNNKGKLLTVDGDDRNFSGTQNECGVCFSSMYPIKVPPDWIYSCFMICVIEFVNHCCILELQELEFFCILCWWHWHICLLCELNKWFSWRCFQSLTNFIHFFLVRTCLLCFLLCFISTLLPTVFSFICKLSYFRQLHQDTFVWIYVTPFVGIVFSTCIIEIHLLLWWNPCYDCKWLPWKLTTSAVSRMGASQWMGLTWYISDSAGND